MKKIMKATMKTIVFIFIIFGTYILGTFQLRININACEDAPNDLSDSCILLDECIPLNDIACFYLDTDGYLCFKLKDIKNQLDNPKNRSYESIIESLEDMTAEYINNNIDMRHVTDYISNGDSLFLYLDDGSYYYYER